MAILEEVTDRQGRRVVLDEAAWAHVLANHPEIAPFRAELLSSVADPVHCSDDPRPGRQRCWRAEVGPSRWLLVVVDWTTEPGRVVTAYARRKDPEGWQPPQPR